MVWSFAAAPVAMAAHTPQPYAPKPHSAWMSATLIAKMKAQAQHAQKMQRRAQAHLYPYMQASQAQHPALLPSRAAFHLPVPLSHLNDAGEMAYAIPQTQIAAWSRELTSAHPAPARAARLHLWLGEWQLAYSRQPETALSHFQAAQRLTRLQDPVYGVAAYDRAFAFYSQGAYNDAVDAFSHVLSMQPRLRGFDRRDAALWLRHAGACAGYHADRERAGIPEPSRLDPLCGAAALASSLRALGCPADKSFVRATMHITGEGSSLQDIVASAQHLGLHTRVLRADDQGLMLLPKPLVAYVEHDHFVSVVRADKKGVSYLCSDCGAWPGGRVNLTWRQWHLLEGGLYVSTALANTPADRLLSHLDPTPPPFATPAALPEPSSDITALPLAVPPVRLAFAGDLSALHLSLRPLAWYPQPPTVDVSFSALASSLQRHVVLQTAPTGGSCGSKGNSPTCPDCTTCCQTAGGGPSGGGPSGGGPGGGGPGGGGPGGGGPKPMKAGAGGPTAGDPVNLATGQEEYSPKADLEVYNPHGPSVTWSRTYNSLRRPGQGFFEPGDNYLTGDFDYEMNDFGQGWSRAYNVGVSDRYPGNIGTSYPKNVFFENGARIQFVVPSLPTASTPQVQCQFYQNGQPAAGIPFLIYANYSAAGLYYSIVFSDRTQWITTAAYSVGSGTGTYSIYPLAQLVDRNGNAITFHYGPAAGGNTAGFAYQWPLLTSITNQDNTALLTVVRANDGIGSIAAVYDCYGRSVLYHVSAYVNHSGGDNISGLPYGTVLYGELDHVSQLVPTGTGTAPDRYVYGYQNIGYGLTFLHTISVPNPSGLTAMSTATINYDNNYEVVTSLVDANGNTTSFANVAVSSSTGGGGGNPGSSTAPDGTLTVASASTATPTNYTQVTVSNGSTLYSYVGGYDMNMSGALTTDGQGRITSSKVFSATSPDPYRPTSQTDGNGNTTQYVYDTFGNLHQKTSPRGTVTNYTYAFPSGQVPSVVNSVAATGTGFGLGEKISEQEGTKTATQYAYYEPSGLIKSINSPLPGTVGAALPMTPTYAYQYDQYGDITQVTARGNNATNTNTTTYSYTTDGPYSQSAAFAQAIATTDNLGHVMHKRFDAQANKVTEIDALGNETDRQYTIANDLYNVIYPATGQTGSGRATDTSTFLYPGGPILTDSKYDESGTQARQVVLTYGNEGELLSQVGDGQPEYITYDALYRPATFSDGLSQATKYTYNSYGYAATQVYPNSDTARLTSYDQAGNLLTQIDPRGVETDYTYADPESRLTDIKYPASPALNVHMHYDSYGRMDTKTDSAGSYTSAYDDLGRLTSAVTTYTNVPAQTISYGYYPDGSYSGMTTPAGTFSYTYDAAGRVATLKNPFNETSSWAFLDNNWLAGQNSGGVLTAAYTHNARGIITDLTNRTTGTNSTLLSEFGSIQYDAVGNMLSVNSTIPTMPSYGGTTSYAYDAKNELKTEQSTDAGGYTGSYGYDGAGNPTTFKGVTSAFNSANQNTANVYDQAGNPTTYKGVALTFDAENRLTSYGGSTLTNGYRGDSQRAWKQDGTNTNNRTYFLYSGSQLICEISSAGAVTATNTDSPGGLISRHTSGGSVFYAFDTHGSVTQRLSSSGSVLSTQTFDAYGSRLSTDSNADPYAGYGGRFGYYTDWETGSATAALELLTLRYYDPLAGRFLTRDPVGYKGGANPYEYVNDGPTNSNDPLGTGLELGAGAACAGVVAALATDSGSGDSCNQNDQGCKALADCIGEAISLVAKVAASMFMGPVAAGCVEGLVSGIAHWAADAICQKITHPCGPPPSLGCEIYSVAMDTLTGCADGFLGGLFEEGLVKQVADGLIEAGLSFVGMGNEMNCDKQKWF